MHTDFEVQFKSSNKAFNELSRWFGKEIAVQLLGQALQAKIIWSWAGGVHEQSMPIMHFAFKGKPRYFPMFDSSFHNAILQKGEAVKLFKRWHFVKDTVGGVEVHDKHLHLNLKEQ